MAVTTDIDSQCTCICHLNQNTIVVDLQQQLLDEIENNKFLVDEINKLILISKKLKQENERLTALIDHTDGGFTPSSKQSIRTKAQKVKEKKDKLNTTPDDKESSIVAPEPKDFKKKGRREGHKGSTKVLVPTEHVHDLQLICKSCGVKLPAEQVKTGGYQTVDIPRIIPMTITQYYSYKVNCTNCVELSAIDYYNLKGTIFGPNAVAFLTNLWYTGVVSLAKVGEIFDYLTGELFSESVIIKALLVAAEAVRPEVAKIKEELVDSKHPHLDETSYIYVDKSRELHWIFVIATQQAVVFEFRPDRKAQFLKDEYWTEEMLKVIIPVVDGWRSYNFFLELQRCWAHILIEAKNHAKLSDLAQIVHQELQELYFDLKQVRSLGLNNYEGIRKQAYNKLETIIARIENSGVKKLREFHKKLTNAKSDLLTALKYPDLVLDNNLAERLLRHLILMRKTRGKVASIKGSEALMLLASFFETCKMKNINPHTRLAELLEGMVGK